MAVNAEGSPLWPEGRPPPRTVFLDLVDTLVHAHPGIPERYGAGLADLGIESEPGAVGAALVAGEELYRASLRSGRGFETSSAEAVAFWREYNELILGHLGVAPGAARAELADTLSNRLWEPASWRVFPEVHGVLAALRAGGLRLAVVSNFTEAIAAVCATHELAEHLDGIVGSCNVGAQKPDVAIFREALRRTGADPETTLHVGDNYVADVLGARAAGLAAVLLDRSRTGGRGMFDFALRDGVGGTGGVALDCPVIGGLEELLALVAAPGAVDAVSR